MWSSVAVLALPMALDPVRLGINLLLISRPRPAQNLLAYWLGCVTACVVLLAVPLLVVALHTDVLAVRTRFGQPGYGREFQRPAR